MTANTNRMERLSYDDIEIIKYALCQLKSNWFAGFTESSDSKFKSVMQTIDDMLDCMVEQRVRGNYDEYYECLLR